MTIVILLILYVAFPNRSSEARNQTAKAADSRRYCTVAQRSVNQSAICTLKCVVNLFIIRLNYEHCGTGVTGLEITRAGDLSQC
jgi:hypothetical protein